MPKSAVPLHRLPTRQLVLSLLCIIAGVVVGYSYSVSGTEEEIYVRVRRWQIGDATGEIHTARKLLELLDTGRADEVRQKLNQRVAENVSELRKRYDELNADERYYVDVALFPAEAEFDSLPKTIISSPK